MLVLAQWYKSEAIKVAQSPRGISLEIDRDNRSEFIHQDGLRAHIEIPEYTITLLVELSRLTTTKLSAIHSKEGD